MNRIFEILWFLSLIISIASDGNEDTQCQTCEGEGEAAECIPNNDMEGENCLDGFGGMGICVVGTCTPDFQIVDVSVDFVDLRRHDEREYWVDVTLGGGVRVLSPWYLIDNLDMNVESEYPAIRGSKSFAIKEDCEPTGYYCEQTWEVKFTVEKHCDFATRFALQFLGKNRNVPDRPAQTYWYEVTIEQGTVRGVCVPMPFKRKIVKELLQRVPEAIDKTRNMVRKIVEKINRDFSQPNTNYQDAQKQIIEEILTRVNGDQPEDFVAMMESIQSLREFYIGTTGELRSASEYDVIQERYMKKLFRIIGPGHMRGFRAYLNRKANQIINENGIGIGHGLFNMLDHAIIILRQLTPDDSFEFGWLVFVARDLLPALKEQYYQDGNPRPEFF